MTRKFLAALLWLVLAGASIDLMTDDETSGSGDARVFDGGGEPPPPSPHP